MVQREFIFDTLRNTFRKFGFLPLETPAMENLEVLTGKYGDEGDRLIFKILNSGEFFPENMSGDQFSGLAAENPGKAAAMISSKALRFDLTVPFARAVVMNQNEITFPFRRYQIQPVWRADRPQRGRYREFYQCDADIVGSQSLIPDAESVAIFQDAFTSLGIPDVTVLLNNRKILSGIAASIGRPDSFQRICIAIDKIGKVEKEKIAEELQSGGLSNEQTIHLFSLLFASGTDQEKLTALRNVFAGIEEGLKGIQEMEEVLSYLSDLGIRSGFYRFEVSLARGLDYYTGTIYEVKSNEVAIGSIASGGRYENLTGVFGKPGLPGTGISFGADRIYDVMAELGRFPSSASARTKALIVNFGDASLPYCMRLVSKLRAAELPAILYPDAVKIAKQFKFAESLSIPFVIIAGESEMKNNEVVLKNMSAGSQKTIPVAEIVAELQNGSK